MWALDRKTDRRGRAAVPLMRFLIECFRRQRVRVLRFRILRCADIVVVLRGKGPGYLPAALPSLRRIVSSRYFTPLPLYGSGGRKLRTLAAARPTASLSIPERITTFLSTAALIPAGSG